MSVTNKSRSWFSAKKTEAEKAEISIYDEIGFFGIRADAFRDELKALGEVKEITLRINSPGGDVFDGLAIFNMLNRHKAKINVSIDGIAASMASVVAMAGDEIVMPENAMMMIHDPWGVVIGNADDMRELADAMDKIKSGMVSAYSAKAKIPRDGIAAMMSAETWLTAEEAIDAGFADKLEQPVSVAAKFDLTKFKNAPRGAAAPTKENDMSDAEKAAAAEAEKKLEAEAKAKAEADAKAKADAEAKAKTEADAKAAAEAGTETPAQIEARVRADMIENHKQIAAACDVAGMPGKATEFIAAGKTLPQVLADLQTLRAEGKGGDTITRTNGKGKDGEQSPAEISALWSGAVDKVNAQNGFAKRK